VNVDLDQLKRYDERITELALAYGLDCFAQEFEVCDHNEMLGYMAYSGMPSRYPHWSYGKSFEKMKTLYDHGAQGLPYEMVINSNPSLAYLMGDNSLCLNVLTIAHVYGHNDFFKNNFTFSHTRPEFTLSSFKSHAERVRSYVEDPSIGVDRVEYILDAAHALSMQCTRNMTVRRLPQDEQRQRAFEASLPKDDPNRTIHTQREYIEPDLRRIPIEPDANLLLFIRDYNPFLMDWEKDLLTIVHEEAQYFIPQIETKIMNEGWASYWHYQIMSNLELPPELRLEFMVHHNQVLRPHPGELNPYHLGFTIWDYIYKSYEGDEPADHRKDTAGRDAIYQARESERDSSFLRRFLNDDLCRRLGLFEFGTNKNDYVVTEIADEQGWQQIREALVTSVGMGSIPIIKVIDGDHEGKRHILLGHSFDGRELELGQAEKTLGYTYRLWGRSVSLDTTINGKDMRLSYDEEGFATSEMAA
jgi:stage V sporulation protein R